MQKDDSLTELIDLVKNIGRIYDDEGITINIDFDHNDGIIMVKYQNENSEKITCIINTNYKTISGFDTTRFWLPDYSKSQKANKKMIQLLERKGYSLSNITYRKK
jgi:hypothetical protein